MKQYVVLLMHHVLLHGARRVNDLSMTTNGVIELVKLMVILQLLKE